MLFDLRGRGRRRTVQTLYVGLALLMGVGLVGFWHRRRRRRRRDLERQRRRRRLRPRELRQPDQEVPEAHPKAAEQRERVGNLTKNLLHESGGSETYVTSAGTVTSKGKELFQQASQAWARYIALTRPNPTPTRAADGVGVR